MPQTANLPDIPSRRDVLWRSIFVFLAYYSCGKLGTLFPFITDDFSLIWVPSGIAVAALLRWSGKMTPAIFMAAFAIELSFGFHLSAALTIALGNTLGSFITVWLLRHWQFLVQMPRRKDVVHFIFASAIGMFISASIASLVFEKEGQINQIKTTWLVLWGSDFAGLLLICPILISISWSSFKELQYRKKEIFFFLSFFTLTHWLIFASEYDILQRTFIALTIAIWSALRFNLSFTSQMVFASAVIATWATQHGLGPFFSQSAAESSIILLSYMVTMVIVSLFIISIQSERQTATHQLQDAFERINKVASRLPGLILQYRVQAHHQGQVLYVSSASEGILEISPMTLKWSMLHFFERIDERDFIQFRDTFLNLETELIAHQQRFQYRLNNGSWRCLYIDALPEIDTDGTLIWHCFITDITDRNTAEQDLRIAAITFESQEGIFVTDPEWRILRLNQAYTRITGFTSEDLIGLPLQRFINEQQDEQFFSNISHALKQHQFWQGELWSERKNGEVFPQMITLTAVSEDDGNISHYIGSFTDISRYKGYEDEILNLAFYDPLTQLPNRRLLMDRLQQLIVLNQREAHHCAILFIDLDNFKILNDTHGHDAGDLLLVQAAQRLQSCVRDSDTVARLGGDEFVVMLHGLNVDAQIAVSQVDLIAEKIRGVLEQAFEIQEFTHHGSASIGVCLFQGGDITVKDLFKRADTAMYEAKTSGRNAVRFFDPAMQAVLVVKMMLESNLRVALQLQQFQLHYQVQVDANDCVTGVEALLRWQHPDRGFIPPIDFIPLAEQTGLIVPIGIWVLETACAQIKAWEKNKHTAHLSIAVNVSAKQFQQTDFVNRVTEIVQSSQIDPTRLKIELTESTILDNVDLTTEKMHHLKKLGIAFSMDDFGTGYSSLAYLQKLPLNQLKIDQSFVHDISDDENDATIVRAIISLGINLGLNVIAEGVETLEQRHFLVAHHCLAFQGYLFSKPLPILDLENFLEEKYRRSP
jgi:diguanylate cyclase (GGDEF)-like protein/PAS domain S-box-containing protein